MSAIHQLVRGHRLTNRRSTRSAGVAAALSPRIVVTPPRRRGCGRPGPAHASAVPPCQRATGTPSRCNCRHTLASRHRRRSWRRAPGRSPAFNASSRDLSLARLAPLGGVVARPGRPAAHGRSARPRSDPDGSSTDGVVRCTGSVLPFGAVTAAYVAARLRRRLWRGTSTRAYQRPSRRAHAGRHERRHDGGNAVMTRSSLLQGRRSRWAITSARHRARIRGAGQRVMLVTST